jgi:hypothetical protein
VNRTLNEIFRESKRVPQADDGFLSLPVKKKPGGRGCLSVVLRSKNKYFKHNIYYIKPYTLIESMQLGLFFTLSPQEGRGQIQANGKFM